MKTMPTSFPFLRLPRELRDQIYEDASLSCGAYLTPNTSGTTISPCSLLLVCRSVSQEYKNVLQSTSPVITARVLDFDFAHVITFLDGLSLRQAPSAACISHAILKRPLQHRRLELVMSLTRDCRQHLEKLKNWLYRINIQPEDYYSASFTTTYAVDDSTEASLPSNVAPITLMRIIDEIYHNWHLQAPAGPYKEEVGKICDCLGEAEMKINRKRTNTMSSGPRMGGLEIF